MNGTPRGSKRQRSPSHHRQPSHQRRASDASGSSLPPSSPLPNFSDTDDGLSDRDLVPDAEEGVLDDGEGDGEDLFDENILQE